jgi:hypothetical protein
VKKTQAENMASALAAGTPNRTRIGLTMGRQLIEEIDFEASSSGVVKRAIGRALPGDGGERG